MNEYGVKIKNNASSSDSIKGIKVKAKEVLKKTQDKYKKVIHSLKTKHKEEIKHLEISIKKEQEEKMKASMLEYENTISELRMNENMAQQKLTEWMNKIKELETKKVNL